MPSRREALLGGAAVAFLGQGVRAQALLGDDGLYRQPWFLESFLELASDLQEAAAQGKRFAILWELKGCPACKRTHLVNFSDPAIVAFVRERFEILQLNIIGAREVTDFDGETLPEKRLAEKYGVRGTPTFQFFPESAAPLKGRAPQEREVARAEGYLEPAAFKRLFAYVAERAYEREGLDAFLKTQG